MHSSIPKETSLQSKSIAKEFQEHRIRFGSKGGYPAELRRHAVSLLHAGHSPLELAKDLKISSQSLHAWRRQLRREIPERPEPRRLSVVTESTPREAGGAETSPQTLRLKLPGGMELSLVRSDLDISLLRILKEVWPC